MNPNTRTALLSNIRSQLHTILMADRGFEMPPDFEQAMLTAIGSINAASEINERAAQKRKAA